MTMTMMMHCFAYTWSSMEEEMMAGLLCLLYIHICIHIFDPLFCWVSEMKMLLECSYLLSPGRQLVFWGNHPSNDNSHTHVQPLDERPDVCFWCCIQSQSQSWEKPGFLARCLSLCPGSSFHKEKKNVSLAPLNDWPGVRLLSGRKQKLHLLISFL